MPVVRFEYVKFPPRIIQVYFSFVRMRFKLLHASPPLNIALPFIPKLHNVRYLFKIHLKLVLSFLMEFLEPGYFKKILSFSVSIKLTDLLPRLISPSIFCIWSKRTLPLFANIAYVYYQ